MLTKVMRFVLVGLILSALFTPAARAQIVHGNGTGDFYDWKDTVGPVEQRRGQANLWECEALAHSLTVIRIKS